MEVWAYGGLNDKILYTPILPYFHTCPAFDYFVCFSTFTFPFSHPS
mgnify:CR=1 FL=1